MKLQGSYRDIVRPQYPTFRGRAQDDGFGPCFSPLKAKLCKSLYQRRWPFLHLHNSKNT